jgi:hypothetical protein
LARHGPQSPKDLSVDSRSDRQKAHVGGYSKSKKRADTETPYAAAAPQATFLAGRFVEELWEVEFTLLSNREAIEM